MRRGLLAAVALFLVSAAPASALGIIDRAHRFNGTLDPHYPAGGPAAEAIGATSFEDGLGRKVLDADAGEGIRVARGDTTADAWAIVLHLRLDQHGPSPQRILAIGDGDEGLYVQNRRLMYRADGGETPGDGDLPAAGEWFQLVVETGAYHPSRVNAYTTGPHRAGVSVERSGGFALGDAIRVFKDDGVEDGAGQIADLRLFSDAVGGNSDDLGGPDDFEPPTTALTRPEFPPFGGFLSARPRLRLVGKDGGRHANRAFARLERPGAAPVELAVQYLDTWPLGQPGTAAVSVPDSAPALPDGAQYDLRYGYVDHAGNIGTQTTSVTIDAVTPTGLTLDAPPERAADRPLITGRVNLAPGDDREVLVTLDQRGRTGQPGARAALSPARPPDESHRVPVQSDGTFSLRGTKEYGVGAIVDIVVGHHDRAANRQWQLRKITIVEPYRPDPEKRADPPAATPAATSFPASAAALLAKQLRKVGLRRLRRAAGVAIAAEADRAGTLRAELRSRGRRPVALARGTVVFRNAGRARMRLRPTRAGRRARRRAVMLRVTFTPRGGRAQTHTQPLTLAR